MIRRKGTFAGRVLVAALFLMGVAASVNAYTIVMRDGRRVEIPETFTVSDSTLTYEVGSGIQVTVQLNTVDIAATERANGGSPGSFLQRSTSPPAKASSPKQTQPRANRSITNKELESYRRARVESEEAYEKTRQELGLPSFEERRKELQAIEDRTVEQVRNMRARQAEIDEAYWRGRAEALSSQAAASQAQVDFARTQVVEGPWAFPIGAGFFPFGTVGFPFGDRRFGRFPFTGFPSVPQFPPFGLTPVFGPFNRVPFRPRIFIAPGTRTHPVHSRPMGGRRR